MRVLIKALVKPRIKTVMVLMFSALIVVMSIHTNISLNGNEAEIIRQLDSTNAPHATVSVLPIVNGEEDMELLYGVLDGFVASGLKYSAEDVISFEQPMHFNVKVDNHSIGYGSSGGSAFDLDETNVLLADNKGSISTQYRSVLGKNITELEDGEVAIPQYLLSEYGLTLDNAIGSIIEAKQSRTLRFLYSLSDFYDSNRPECTQANLSEECNTYGDVVTSKVIEVKVASVVQDLSYAQSDESNDFNASIDFFMPDRDKSRNYVFSNENTISKFRSFSEDILEDEKVNVFNFFKDFGLNEDHILMRDDRFSEIVMEVMGDKYPVKKLINIRFDNYSKGLEDKVAAAVSRINISKPGTSVQPGFRLNTLQAKMDKEPMVTSVLKVLSNYVLLGVLLSSFYAFYIHFRNQIRVSSKEIAALIMQGIPWISIVSTYLLELALIALVSLGLFGVTIVGASLMGLSVVLYATTPILIIKSMGYSLVYFGILVFVVVVSLLPFKKNILMKFKRAAQTQISFVKLTKSNLVSSISIKRLFKYIASTVGFAFSISLVGAVIVLSLSSSFHLKNLYSKETFGMEFDYMILGEMEDMQEIYEGTLDFAKVQAQVYKREDILFMNHDLWEGNSRYYKSSEIVFINDIEEFVPLESGAYPKHWSENTGMHADTTPQALVSRRHIDKRNIGSSSRVEDKYLFYYPNESSFYEEAYGINGKINALYNNGWALYTYEQEFISEGNIIEVRYPQYVLNLKEDVDATVFEAYLNEHGIEYLKYDLLLSDFQVMNNAMNERALLISLTVSILMAVLLFINISGLVISVNSEVASDNELMLRLGVKNSLVQRINVSVYVLRVIGSLVMLGALISIVYPIYFKELLGAFGLFSMPGSILKGFVLVCSVLLVVLVVSFLGLRKHRS